MRYQLVLYDLKNGLDRVKGRVVNERPEDAWVMMAKVLYGAKRAEVLELPEATGTTEQLSPEGTGAEQ